MSVTMGPNVGDNIDNLPTDKNTPSHNEVKMVETLFKEQQSTVNKVLSGAKEFVFLFLLFCVLSLPQVNMFLAKILPVASSQYICILVKGVIFTVVYFLIKNIYLVKKQS